MSDTKMLQMVLDKVSSLGQKMDEGFKGLRGEIIKNRDRIDKLGTQMAELEDDA